MQVANSLEVKLEGLCGANLVTIFKTMFLAKNGKKRLSLLLWISLFFLSFRNFLCSLGAMGGYPARKARKIVKAEKPCWKLKKTRHRGIRVAAISIVISTVISTDLLSVLGPALNLSKKSCVFPCLD